MYLDQNTSVPYFDALNSTVSRHGDDKYQQGRIFPQLLPSPQKKWQNETCWKWFKFYFHLSVSVIALEFVIYIDKIQFNKEEV